MVSSILQVTLIHLSYWVAGAIAIKSALPNSTLFSLRQPHWFAAYLFGLSLNVIVTFTLDQFFGLALTLPLLLGSAGALILFVALPTALGKEFKRVRRVRRSGWPPLTAFFFMVAATVFLQRHLGMLWDPLEDWDTFLYHLRFGESIYHGRFPSDIGPSYNLQMEAAYPPLFFFIYGLNFWLQIPSATFFLPKLTVVILNLLVCLSTYYLARHRLFLRTEWSIISTLLVCLVLNTAPNMQSATTLYLNLALYYSWGWLAKPVKSVSISSGLVAAVFWAGCYWVSYLGLTLGALFFGGLVILGALGRLRGFRYAISASVLIGTILALIVCILPHMLRNLLVAGNPIFPALLESIGGIGVTEWSLDNRAVVRPIHYGLSEIPMLFATGVPLSTLLLGAIFVVPITSSLRSPTRFLALLMLGGFSLIWIFLLQMTKTPTFRFLYPLVPLSVCFVCLQLQEAWRRPDWKNLLAASSLPALLAWVVLAVTRGRGSPIADATFWCLLAIYLGAVPALVFVACGCEKGVGTYLGRALVLFAFLCVGVLCRGNSLDRVPQAVFLGLLVIVGLLSQGLDFKGRVSGRFLAAFLALFVVVFVVLQRDHRGLTDFVLDIRSDIDWINENLPEDAVILTMEDRLFTLERRYVPGDDYRLEDFYETGSAEGAVARLRDFGITHILLTPVLSKWRPFSEKLDVLRGDEQAKPWVREIYRSRTAVVLEVSTSSCDREYEEMNEERTTDDGGLSTPPGLPVTAGRFRLVPLRAEVSSRIWSGWEHCASLQCPTRRGVRGGLRGSTTERGA